jgi:EAL domain-containing protein (putative c-di-GMP-specific phosphodiesterase class I)
MSRELTLRRHDLFPGSVTVDLGAAPRTRLDHPRMILALGAAATAVLIALELLDAGGQAALFESIYTPLAAGTGALVLAILSRRREAAMLEFGTLAGTLTLAGLAMVVLDLAPLIGRSAAVVAANVIFMVGVGRAMTIIVPALYRQLDRRTLVMAGVDGAIVLIAGTTLLMTLWRSGRGGGLDEMFVPIAAASLLGSSGMAAIAAFTKRAAPGFHGVWCGIAGVFIVGLAWAFWVDLLLHGGLRNAPASMLYAGGVLLLAYAWMTWDDETGGGAVYERVARALVDWLPIGAIGICVVVTVLPHGHIEGVDPAPLGTAAVVMISIVRQRILIVRERWASHRLTSEVEERAQTMLSLARLERADNLAQTAARICAEALRLDGIDTAAVYVFNPAGGAVPLALAGEHREGEAVDEPLGPKRALQMRAQASAGAWVYSPGPDSSAEEGLPLGEAFAPMRWDDRIVGVVSMGTRCLEDADRLHQRLPTVTEFGVVSSALLGPMLTDHWRLDDIRCQLNAIIAEHAFTPVFQAVVSLQTREIVGFEALTRFSDGTRPDQRFIEADTAGMSVKLEMACLKEQIEAASWLPPGVWVSLNVSPTLASAVVPLISALERAERDVVLEITEHVEIADYRQLVSALELVRTRVRLAVDDAGAGYAGLRHILELRPQFVKLDLSLVRHVDTDPARQAMCAGMAHFARNAGCELIAEGIETEGELNELIRLGISLGQGYLFGKPGPVAAD